MQSLSLEPNEPTLLPDERFDVLNEIAHKTYRDPRGNGAPYLSPRKSFFVHPARQLDADERRRSNRMCCTASIFSRKSRGPKNSAASEIVRAHHEKLNGRVILSA